MKYSCNKKTNKKSLNPIQLVDLTARKMSEIKEKAEHHEKAVSLIKNMEHYTRQKTHLF